MNKNDKKKARLQERIAIEEGEIRAALQSKKNGAAEINLVDRRAKIAKLEGELRALK